MARQLELMRADHTEEEAAALARLWLIENGRPVLKRLGVISGSSSSSNATKRGRHQGGGGASEQEPPPTQLVQVCDSVYPLHIVYMHTSLQAVMLQRAERAASAMGYTKVQTYVHNTLPQD